MTDSDLEPGTPLPFLDPPRQKRSPGAASHGVQGEPRFSNAVTIVLSVFLSAGLFCESILSGAVASVQRFERPVDTTVRVFERDLALEDALQTASPIARALVAPLVDAGNVTRGQAIEAFEDVLRHGGYPSDKKVPDAALLDGLRARRAVLLAEAGRIEDAQGDLDKLARGGNASFVAALRRAYAKTKSDDAQPFAQYDVSLAGDGWIGTRIRTRLAHACGERDAAAALERETAARGNRLTQRAIGLGSMQTVLMLAGVVLALAWLARNRPDGERSSASIPPVWSFETGFAVLVRAAFLGVCIDLALELIDFQLSIHAFTLWVSLFAAIPLLVLVRRGLLEPRGQTFASAFGLGKLANPLSWLAFTLGLFALDQLGGQAIQAALGIVGLSAPWPEHVEEIALWTPRAIALLDGIDGVLWVPIVEEIGFRGLLYLTLRRHYGPWQAALLSGAIFGAVHLDSLPGLLSITWSGFVWALAFERCRSLVPGMVCHALNNAFVLGTAWLFYR